MPGPTKPMQPLTGREIGHIRRTLQDAADAIPNSTDGRNDRLFDRLEKWIKRLKP